MLNQVFNDLVCGHSSFKRMSVGWQVLESGVNVYEWKNEIRSLVCFINPNGVMNYVYMNGEATIYGASKFDGKGLPEDLGELLTAASKTSECPNHENNI